MKHTALLVEDDLNMAKHLRELLSSLGHGCVHSESQEGAQAIVESGEEICYALVDLQIKITDESMLPVVEAGQNLLQFLRGPFPRRNGVDHHHLPILVMSGHSKDTPSVIKALQDGADDFILKPLQENKPGFAEKIREALRKSGRDHHLDCPAATLEALGAGTPESSAAASVRLDIPGRQVTRRIEVLVSGKSVHLTTSSFILLLHLVANRLRADESWVHKNDLGARSDQGWKGITRLKEELREGLPSDFDPTVNDKSGNYRLHPGLSVGRVDTQALSKLGDARISALASQIGRLQRELGRKAAPQVRLSSHP